MSTVPFDTLKLATALREQAHFTPEQAEGITRAFGEAFEERIATREDISDLKHDIERLDAKIAHLDAKFEAKLESLEQRLTIKMGGMFVVAIGVITGLMKIIHG
jgi:flagellar motility protein MotE (MotC chaperone)